MVANQRSCTCVPEDRRNIGNYCSTTLVREHSVTSTVAPVGSGKEIEYFFASDARFRKSVRLRSGGPIYEGLGGRTLREKLVKVTHGAEN